MEEVKKRKIFILVCLDMVGMAKSDYVLMVFVSLPLILMGLFFVWVGAQTFRQWLGVDILKTFGSILVAVLGVVILRFVYPLLGGERAY